MEHVNEPAPGKTITILDMLQRCSDLGLSCSEVHRLLRTAEGTFRKK